MDFWGTQRGSPSLATERPAPEHRLRRRVIGVALAAAVVCGQFYLARSMAALSKESGEPSLSSALILGGLICVAVALLIPTGPLTLGSGIVLGVGAGSVTVLAGTTLGDAIAFLLARTALSGRAERLMQAHPRMRRIRDAVSQEGWRLVFLTRLIPAFPCKLSNYVFGLSCIRFVPFLLASFLGTAPNAFAVVYAGHMAGQAVGMVPSDAPGSPMGWLIRALGLVALLMFVLITAVGARRELREHWNNHHEANALAPPESE